MNNDNLQVENSLSNLDINIRNFDKKFIYHPYADLNETHKSLEIVKTKGVYLYTSDGQKLIDGVSSWWACWNGYGNKDITKAMKKQLDAMSHVMFAGLTHNGACTLAKKLSKLTPGDLDYFFYSDSGSVSTEIALKIAIQYQNNKEKVNFMALKNGYHGDTLGAMSVSDWGEHHIYDRYTRKVHYFNAEIGFYDNWDKKASLELEKFFKENAQDTAAFILEPIMQGAGGMKLYHPNYLIKIRELCNKYDILLICDEIATGFYRTGKMFAVEYAKIIPDIMLIGKGLTAGFMTLSAVITNKKVYDKIASSDIPKIMHGPTFMANPLACACAIASIDALLKLDAPKLVHNIEKTLKKHLEVLKQYDYVKEVRVLGAMAAIELNKPCEQLKMQEFLINKGVWLRPFGNIVYIYPPFIISKKELKQGIDAVISLIENYNNL